MSIKLAIVGSRTINEEQKALTSSILLGIFTFYNKIDLVISGGAEGVDTLAAKEAKDFGLTTKVFLPYKKQWTPDGYKERNIQIAKECTHLFCIRTRQSGSYGSGWTAEYAESLGKPVWNLLI